MLRIWDIYLYEVSILVLMDSRVKTPPSRTNDSLRPLVSILVLMDSRVKTESQATAKSIGLSVSILVLMDSRVKTPVL